MKTTWTKDEAIQILIDVAERKCMPDKSIIEMIMAVERVFYTKHINNIRERQDRLKYLYQDDNRFLAFWFGGKYRDAVTYKPFLDVISPGCRACLTKRISHVRHATECSQHCAFCYYDVRKVQPIGKGLYQFSGPSARSGMSFTLDESKLVINRQIQEYTAIGWLHREPLERPNDIYPLMEYISKTGVHQYMYTNGVKASKPIIDRLAQCGLKELRFNLVSTYFSDLVIDNMAYAKEKLDWVLIETPIFSTSHKLFVEKGKDIIHHTGVDQINMPELQICDIEKLGEFEKTEGVIYKHRRGYVSPVSSRHYIYDLIELAEREDWPVIINDCSNDTKYFRGVHPGNHLGAVDYISLFELPFASVIPIVNLALEDGVTYEFF